MELVEELDDEPLKEELQIKVAELVDVYEVLSKQYHEGKEENLGNSLVFA
jgi:hypothetical protein